MIRIFEVVYKRNNGWELFISVTTVSEMKCLIAFISVTAIVKKLVVFVNVTATSKVYLRCGNWSDESCVELFDLALEYRGSESCQLVFT